MEPIISKYQYNNEKTIGGYSLTDFMNNNQILYGGGTPSYIPQSSERFKNLIIPAGFVMQPQGTYSSMTIKPNKVLTIPDKMFDSVFENISKKRTHNKTKKILIK